MAARPAQTRMRAYQLRQRPNFESLAHPASATSRQIQAMGADEGETATHPQQSTDDAENAVVSKVHVLPHHDDQPAKKEPHVHQEPGNGAARDDHARKGTCDLLAEEDIARAKDVKVETPKESAGPVRSPADGTSKVPSVEPEPHVLSIGSASKPENVAASSGIGTPIDSKSAKQSLTKQKGPKEDVLSANSISGESHALSKSGDLLRETVPPSGTSDSKPVSGTSTAKPYLPLPTPASPTVLPAVKQAKPIHPVAPRTPAAAAATKMAVSLSNAQPATQLASKMATPTQSGSIALEIARMVSEFLGPLYPRRESVGATLSGLRTRLETNTAKFDQDRETLIWQTREAIRTEFFKVIYPSAPSPILLSLVTQTEILLTGYDQKTRPFFFPGARVTVPTEGGSRRAGTTLQLRFKTVGDSTVTEALLHLDGPNGGGFQWVQTPALTPLLRYIPLTSSPSLGRRIPAPKCTPARAKRPTKSITKAPRVRAPRPSAAAKKKLAAAKAAAIKPAIIPAPTPPTPPPKKTEILSQIPPRPPSPPPGPAALPPAFLPKALLSTSPPPRKRIRMGLERPILHTSGSLRRALELDTDIGEVLRDSINSVRRLIGIERLVARRHVSNTGEVEYFVKWSGRRMDEGSWERRMALMFDVPALVMEFDTKHPGKPKPVCHSDRKKAPQEGMETCRSKSGPSTLRAQSKVANTDYMQGTRGSVKVADEGLDIAEQISHGAGRKFVDDISGVEIPDYLDTPILELGFSGMILHVRQSKDWTMHNDALAVVRDYKKRQSRFKQENIRSAEKLFLLTKSEARMALDASLRSHKLHNRYPIPFPRGLGRAVPLDMNVPFSQEVVKTGPPSLESYLFSLGMRPRYYERDLPPLLPTLDAQNTRSVAAAARDASFERHMEHRERARRLLREAYRHTNNTNPPAFLFRDGRRRPLDCNDCFPAKETRAAPKTKSPRLPEPTIKQEPVLVAALSAAASKPSEQSSSKGKGERWFDPIWNCWRGGEGPSVQ